MTDDLPFARRAPYARLAIGWFPLGYFCAVWLRRGYQGFGEGANAMKTEKEALSIRVGKKFLRVVPQEESQLMA